MTYEPRYKVVTGTGKNVEGLTLYEASKVLDELGKSGDLEDVTHIRRGRRAVGFFCEWRGVVYPMFQANDQEAHVLRAWAA